MKNFLSLALILIAFSSCTKDDNNLESNSKSLSGEDISLKGDPVTVIDTTSGIEFSKEAMVGFVGEIKRYYRSGMTYEELKKTLDPDTQLAEITTEGDDLLKEAFNSIENKVEDRDLNPAKMLVATQAIIKYNMDELGVEYVDDVDFELGSQWLFGLKENSQAVMAESDGCKWYQLGCWISKAWKWLSSTANGGGASNGVTLAAVFTIAGVILGAILSGS